jgi:hypothetical protein
MINERLDLYKIFPVVVRVRGLSLSDFITVRYTKLKTIGYSITRLDFKANDWLSARGYARGSQPDSYCSMLVPWASSWEHRLISFHKQQALHGLFRKYPLRKGDKTVPPRIQRTAGLFPATPFSSVTEI